MVAVVRNILQGARSASNFIHPDAPFTAQGPGPSKTIGFVPRLLQRTKGFGSDPFPYTPWDCHICRSIDPAAPPLAVSRHIYGSPMSRAERILRDSEGRGFLRAYLPNSVGQRHVELQSERIRPPLLTWIGLSRHHEANSGRRGTSSLFIRGWQDGQNTASTEVPGSK